MKTRRMILSSLLVLVMLLCCACSQKEDIKAPSDVKADSSVTDKDDNKVSNDDNKDDSNSAVKVTIAETVLYDDNSIKVTATGYEDGWMGPEIKVLVENNSDKDLLITADRVSVNGYMSPYSSLFTEVAAGKKAKESFYLSSSDLEQSGIETVAEIQFCIDVSDSESWDTLYTSDLITLSTSAAGLEQPVDDSGDLLYDAEGIKVVCKGLKQDEIWDGTLIFYMENNSDQPITVYAEDVSINDSMAEVSLWSDLRAGTKIVDGMTLLDLEDLELESIDDVKSIDFKLRVINSETWNQIATTDEINLTFE